MAAKLGMSQAYHSSILETEAEDHTRGLGYGENTVYHLQQKYWSLTS